LIVILGACRTSSDPVRVAVAANFSEPARELAALFEETSGRRAVLSFGSTGQLFTQIAQGAPFDVLLAADQETPARVIAEGLGVNESLFTYAIGEIVLYGKSVDLSEGEGVLRRASFQRLAIANPVTAPYGRAALEVIQALGLEALLRPKLVQGNNIAQTFQFVETGNAELGFVARSQVLGRNPASLWRVPPGLYSPIRQDAVLLKGAAARAPARQFFAFLAGPDARRVIRKYGYGTSPR
jgi:molybdate transport system substrate-binding protein